MQFGLFYAWPNPTLRNRKTLFEEGMEQIQYSEALGFDYCLIAEHHFSNYGNSPAPLMQALYIGQRTRRLKIGTAAVILPVWQPLRLAEEVAVLDTLMNGPFLCGVGRGYQAYEMAGFGGNLEESRGKFAETPEVLLKAWTQAGGQCGGNTHQQLDDVWRYRTRKAQAFHSPHGGRSYSGAARYPSSHRAARTTATRAVALQ